MRRHSSHRFLRRTFVIGALLIYGACAEEEIQVPKPVIPKKLREKESKAPTDGSEGSVKYFYNQLAKRDPFRRMEGEVDVQRDFGRTLCREPLCEWGLEQLKLVAIISGNSTPIAMMEDPTGYGHIVRKNARVGQKGGRVTQVLRDCIVVTEYASEGATDKKNPIPTRLCVNESSESSGPTEMNQ